MKPILSAWEKVAFFCRIADEKKVGDIVVLQVGGLTPIADYFVIGTCENPLHIDAVAEEMELRAKQELGLFLRRSGEPRSNWVILDADDVIVHLFNPDLRDYYDLETLWAAAERWIWVGGALRQEALAL
jgi:ribosome-associated protein